jgi:hypothetical protein
VSGQRAVHELRAEAPPPLGGVRTALLAVGLCACAAVAGLALAGEHTRIGSPPHLRGLTAAPGYLLSVEIALAVVVAAALAVLLRPTRKEDDDEEDERTERVRVPFWHRLVAIAVVVAAVLLSLLALALLPRSHHPFLRGSGTAGQPHPSTAAKAQPGGSALQVHWIVLGVALALGLAVLAWFALARRAPASGPFADEPEAEPDLPAGDPEDESDPRRAVLKAYAGMERAYREDGLPRRATEAPHEYLGRVRVARRAAARLTALFERARFSRHVIDEPMRRDALDALAEVRSELEGGP